MYLQKETIPNIAETIAFYIKKNKFIEISRYKTRKIEINIALILFNIWLFNKEIDADIYKIILKKKISTNKFVEIRQNISNTWVHKENKNSIYFISLKILSLLLTTNNITEIYVTNNILQNSIIKILKHFLVIIREMEYLILNSISSLRLQKGSLEWELAYIRTAYNLKYKIAPTKCIDI